MPDPTAAPPVCVYCRRHPVEAAYRPFCSKRCRLLDLSRWVDGDYRIAGESMADEATIEDADPAAGSASGPAERPASSKGRPR
ncbi:MAG: DNA gyrase inhibitor YacG [Vicinamibacteria bacterium]